MLNVNKHEDKDIIINLKPRIGVVMVNVLVSRAVDRGLGVPVGSNLRLLNWYVLLSAK